MGNQTLEKNGAAETSDAAVETPEKKDDTLAKALAGLKLRGIGPALMGGRIADIAVHPHKRSTWYVAVGSGGLWKTTNAGTTWQPVFDEQPSYSLGCVTIDPNNPDVVWVGTGENVSGRHVGWGDGVYRSRNGGKKWERMGLENSQHIGEILVDPRDSNVVFVAAEGPLWSAGGERGLYKTADGGASWTAVLEIDENTGVTDVVFDPTNPDVLYAAAYQRRRSVAAFMGGGPSSGIYKSADGGETWRRLEAGLPKGDMGKIGLAISPAAPETVYATIEAGEKEKGFYRSRDRGESWEKRNEYISGGTGPHYYQVIEASPTNADVVYQMDVFIHVTRDGGANFQQIEDGQTKHSDNHALWIDPDDGQHLLLGCDAGLYESFDESQTWRHFPNLPVSQFYRLALDNSEPFYNVLGGAQDLGTLFGPTRTMNIEGVRNQDWYVPLGADGYHVAFDPEEPYILYLEFQNGNLFRYDRRSEEIKDIKPFPAPGEPPERWNWDAPILISPHNRQRVYYASQRLWRSDDRGESWTAVSGDLTRNLNRYELEMAGRVWSVDDLYDHGAMSQYSNITNLSESPVVEGVLYVGTDDGLIQVSEDGGQTWRVAGALPEVPEYSFVQCVEASQHDADTVFAVADAHKIGNFSPYVFVSHDKGHTWRSIANDIPEGTIVWAVTQDHVNPDLLFAAAEFGLYVSVNGGENWSKLSGNVPTIAFRDLKLHRRDEDLVGASFGRGFYVLDDYTALRDIAEGALEKEAHLFPVRDAWWYVPYTPMQTLGQPTLGSTYFTAENPPFGALITYYVKEAPLSKKEQRHKTEKELREQGQNIPFPSWERLRMEATDEKPKVMLLIRDADGRPLRWLEGAAEAGLQRTNWDLRLAPTSPIKLEKPAFVSPWQRPPQGPMVSPGQYAVELFVWAADGLQPMGEPQSFTVKAVPTAPDGTDFAAVAEFQRQAAELLRRVSGAGKEIERTKNRLKHIKAALIETPQAEQALLTRTHELDVILSGLSTRLLTDEVRGKLNEPSVPTIQERVGRVIWGVGNTRQMPTATQRTNLQIAQEEFEGLVQELATLIEHELAELEQELEAAGAPWTPGRKLG